MGRKRAACSLHGLSCTGAHTASAEHTCGRYRGPVTIHTSSQRLVRSCRVIQQTKASEYTAGVERIGAAGLERTGAKAHGNGRAKRQLRSRTHLHKALEARPVVPVEACAHLHTGTGSRGHGESLLRPRARPMRPSNIPQLPACCALNSPRCWPNLLTQPASPAGSCL